jgi:hypothetical protein
MSFLDIDQILSEEERIPCVFRLDAKGLGFLDATVESDDIAASTRVELPMWLALSLSKKRTVSIELPKHFDKKMREEISAGASSINFRDYSFYYFDVGMQISKELNDKDLQKNLCLAFCGEKFRALMVRALSRYAWYSMVPVVSVVTWPALLKLSVNANLRLRLVLFYVAGMMITQSLCMR